MNIISVKIADLCEDPNNARKHGLKNLKAIKGSLAKFGQQKPIVINRKNIVIAGNGTLAAAKELKWEKIDAVVTDLDDLNQMAFALADNKTSELAEWDIEVLDAQLAILDEHDMSLDDIGFDDRSLNFEPGSEDDQGKLDEKQKKLCPHCGLEI